MGGDLKKIDSKAPTFIVWAVKDPTSGNLDRIQIIKGWSKSGQSFEKIFDVAWSGDRKPDVASGKVPAIRSTVDLANATYTNTIGSTELKTVWTDPEFDPSLHAFYYARALENCIDAIRNRINQAGSANAKIPGDSLESQIFRRLVTRGRIGWL